ncbi:hypothetical protein EAH75_03060 [Rhodanobacter glycinis]|uniref:Uncharacterized protein n=1 Tax=Rhodanobacter glycinis TaxID=582702 RepID=A0A502FM00_9GAMM|nr:hypothetical protein [Rhodanobacter glycinis]TPG05891.1 hypothetical protein EAH88_14695 [Rhodanobacter glycinis]TPG50451.1 hypothetical protein EAH75_03060 [Rhodanobacter glycinis]
MTTPLPPQGSPEPDEKLPGEAELAALYRQLPQIEPGPALDAAVLRAAAQALAPGEESPTLLRERRKASRERGDWVHPKQNASTPVVSLPAGGNRRRPRWLIALSSAATLVLAAGLAWHMHGLPSTESAPAAVNSAAPTQAAAVVPAPAAPSAAAMQQAEPVPPPSEPPKQPPPKMVVAASRTTAANTLRKVSADQDAERASSKAQVAGGLARFAPAPAGAPAAPPVTLQETANDSAVAMPSVAEAAPKMPANAVAAPAPAELAADEATARNASDTSAQELDKIRQLFAQGHDDEARQRLTAFQHAHPEWNLSPELRAQLRKP